MFLAAAPLVADDSKALQENWPSSQIPECTCSISHNVHISVLNGALWVWNRCILGSVFHAVYRQDIYCQWGKLNAKYSGELDITNDEILLMMTSSNGNIFCVTGPLYGEFTGHRWNPIQRPVTRNFDVFFDLCPNKQLSKQSRGWWFEMPPGPLWSHCNVMEWFSSRFTQPKQINITLIQVTIEVFLLYSLVYFIVR